MKFIQFFLFSFFLLTSCVERGKVEVSGLGSATPSVTHVSVKDGKLHLKGNALHSARQLKVDDTPLTIESQSESSLVASATEALSLTTSAVFDLVISNAQGSSTYPIELVIKDGDITASKLDDMGAMTGQILKYDGSSWVASDLEALIYAGTWDATTGTEPSSMPNPGEYYIVSVAADNVDFGDGRGPRDWDVRDWVVYNATDDAWDQVKNDSGVLSFNGREGEVTPQSGDYTWAQIDKTTAPIDDLSDVDTSTSSPSSGQVLKWDGSNWAPGADNNSGGVTDVTGTSPISSTGGSTPDISISQAGSSSNGYLSSTDWNTFNDKAENPSSACSGSDKLTWDGTSFLCAADVDTDTSAQTICSGSDYLAGDGTCQAPTTDTDTNAGTICATGEYLDGDGTCKTAATDAGEFLADGSVAMTGNFDGGGNNLTNVGSLFTNNQAGVTLKSYGPSAGQTGETRFNDLDDSNYVGLKAPDTVSTNQIWALPASDGSSGNVLTTDGSGNLAWASSGDGSVTAVTGTAPISSTGGSTPDISISQAGTSSNGYLSSTDWNTFNNKESAITSGTTAQYWRGDKTWQTLDTSVVPENGNLYFTNSRAQTAVVEDNITDGTTNKAPSENAVFDALATKEDSLGTGLAGQYLDENKTWQDLNTDAVAEATNLYFTESRVLGSLLSGYSVGTDAALADGDTLLQALGKLEAQIQADASNAFLKDGSVAMTGNFDGGGNNLTNVGSLTTSSQGGVVLNPYGTSAGNTGEVRFMELAANGSNYLGFKAPDALSANQIWQLPASDGTSGNVLTTDGSGNLSWGSSGDGSVTSVTGTAPIASSGGTTPDISISQAGTSSNGYLSSTDWNTFNNKEPAITAGTTAQYWRGDKTWQTLDTSVVPENGNLYFTNSRAQTAVVEDSITDGTTNKAPSQNAVFDALATKVDLAGDTMTGDLTVPALFVDATTGNIHLTDSDQFADSADSMQLWTSNASGSGADLSVRFLDNSAGTSSNITTFTSNGNVGIGTSSPSQKLHMNGGNLLLTGGDSTLSRAYLTVDSVGNKGEEGGLLIKTDGDARTSSGKDKPISVQTDAGGDPAALTEKFTVWGDGEVYAAGKIGIGTTSPQDQLHLESASNTTIRLREDTSDGLGKIQFTEGDLSIKAKSSSVDQIISFYTSNAGTEAERMRIDKSGNLGIGTQSPGAQFDLEGGFAGKAFNSSSTPHRFEWGEKTISSDVDNQAGYFWTSVTFSQSFTSAPLVFCTVQSRNGSDVPRVCDVKSVTSTGFDLGFCEAEDTQSGTCDAHSDEQVGWIAIGEDTGADLAEYYRSTELLEKGEIVEPDPDNPVFVRRGNGRSELPPIGIVSSNPGKVMGEETEDSHLVALSGRVPVKVTMENGPIATGDKVSPSLIRSGYGKKFREGDQYSIGIALNDQSKSGKVMVLLSNETHPSEKDHYRRELNAKNDKIKKLRSQLQRQEREISQMKEAIKSIQQQMRIKK